MGIFGPTFSAKNKKNSERLDKGIEHVQNFRVYLSKTAWTIGLWCG